MEKKIEKKKQILQHSKQKILVQIFLHKERKGTKRVSEIAWNKAAEVTGDLLGNKIADEITLIENQKASVKMRKYL